MLLLVYLFITIFLVSLILFLFSLSSKKMTWDFQASISFECGYTSYFFSRFSFSMHYYLIGLIFLFLDLELCILMPFFNEDFSCVQLIVMSWTFVLILILSVVWEWGSGKLEWKF